MKAEEVLYIDNLKKGIFLLIILFVIQIPKMAGQQLYKLDQIEGTEENVHAILSPFLSSDQNHIYVFGLKPMLCPRCEGTINPLITYLKRIDQDAPIIMIVDHSRQNAIKKYSQRRNFSVDTVLTDGDGLFSKNFHYNVGEVSVPFIMKFDASGQMLLAHSLLGSGISESYAKKLFDHKEIQKKISRDEHEKNSAKKADIKTIKPSLKFQKAVKLDDNTDFPLSEILSFAISGKDGYFNFIDRLSSYVYVYEQSGSFKNALTPTEEEEWAFVDSSVNETTFAALKKMNIVNMIYLKVYNREDNSVLINGSLPKVSMNSDDGVDYFNQISFINKDFENKVQSIKSVEIPPDDDLTFSHGSTIFLKDYSLIPTVKGWPTVGTSEFNPNDIEESPFEESFYDNAPIYAVFDSKGNLIKTIGTLPKLNRDLRLGYYFCSPVAGEDEQYVYITSGQSGLISVFDKSKDFEFVKDFSVFTPSSFWRTEENAKMKVYDKGDSTTIYSGSFYYEENKPKRGEELQYFKNLEDDLKMKVANIISHDGQLYVLIKGQSHYEIKVYDKDHKVKTEDIISMHSSAFGELKKCFLNIDKNGVNIIGVFDNKKDFYVGKIKLSKAD